MCRVYIKWRLINSSYLCTHLLKNSADKWNIADVRYIFNLTRLVTKDYCRDNCYCGVFCTADIYFTKKRLTAVYYKLFQTVTLQFHILYIHNNEYVSLHNLNLNKSACQKTATFIAVKMSICHITQLIIVYPQIYYIFLKHTFCSITTR